MQHFHDIPIFIFQVKTCITTEPREGHRTVFLSFFILLPQVSKSLPKLENCPHNLASHSYKILYCSHKLTSRNHKILSCSHKLESRWHKILTHSHKLLKSLPQDTKSFPQVSKSFPQVSKLLPQDSKSFPKDMKSLPQVLLSHALMPRYRQFL